MNTYRDNATLRDVVYCTDGHLLRGTITIEDGIIAHLSTAEEVELGALISQSADTPLAIVLPGVIDTHVHTREPGLTHKGDLTTETLAAAAGGVTSMLDMPNVVPQTTTAELLHQRFEKAASRAFVNYSFLFGATAHNVAEIRSLDPTRVPAVKLFMGSSTGDMLVDKASALHSIFKESPLPIVAHCEDQTLINASLHEVQAAHGADPDVHFHPLIRSREACLASTRKAIALAEETGARLHVAHISTREELDLQHSERVTIEACVPHLLFCDDDYARLGTRIKCNPAIKGAADRDALRRALTDGRIASIATDHAPHLLSEKRGGCVTAASGIPMVQFSLPSMLTLMEQGVLPLTRLVYLMCHQPAAIFGITDRGHIAEGMQADLVTVERRSWRVTAADVVSRCGWSPLEGQQLEWKVVRTRCNGRTIFDHGSYVPDNQHAMPLRFKEHR